MYQIPSLPDVVKVVIDASVIKGESDPILVYETSGQAQASSEY